MKLIQESTGSGNPAWTEKQAKHMYFHIVSQTVQDGIIAKVGTTPWAVYCAIKSHANLETGNAWPSNARLGALVGCSVDTVQRSMKTLLEAGLVAFENRQQGKTNKYTITESIKVDEKDGTPWAVGERKYVPLDFGDFAEQMRLLAKDGTFPTDKSITINLVLNVQQNAPGSNGTMNIENIQVLNADALASLLNKNKTA